MPGLDVLHAWLASGAAILATGAVVLGALVALGAAGRRAGRRWLDRLVLALLVVVAADVVLGGLVGILALGGRVGPADPLHFVYAMVALLAVPVVRLEAMRRRSARLGWWVCAGGLVTLGALLRLWATGG
jgi:hypothetical protein